MTDHSTHKPVQINGKLAPLYISTHDDYRCRSILQLPVYILYLSQSLNDFLAEMLIVPQGLNITSSDFKQALYRLQMPCIELKVGDRIFINEQHENRLFRLIESISNVGKTETRVSMVGSFLGYWSDFLAAHLPREVLVARKVMKSVPRRQFRAITILRDCLLKQDALNTNIPIGPNQLLVDQHTFSPKKNIVPHPIVRVRTRKPHQ